MARNLPNQIKTARTYPATGQFTPPQRELYLAVLSAQKALINLCTESAGMTMWELHRMSSDLMKGELRQLGFDFGDKPRSGSASRIFGGAGRGSTSGKDAMEVLYPHFLSHPIGIGEGSLIFFEDYGVDVHLDLTQTFMNRTTSIGVGSSCSFCLRCRYILRCCF